MTSNEPPELNYLRTLLGDAWIDAEVFADNPTHLLGRWHKSDPNSPWVRYIEELVKFIHTDGRIKCASRDLKRKLRAEFTSTLVEIESAVFFARQGFAVTMEPTAPKKGPDLRVDCEGTSYFVEIREVGLDREDDRIILVSKEIYATFNNVPSAYSVRFTIGDKYIANSPMLRAAIAVVLDALEGFNEDKPKKAMLYYAHPNGKLLSLGGNSCDPRGAEFSKIEKNRQDIVDRADFIARFRHLGKEQTGTPATVMKQFKSPPEPVKSHERLKSILVDKISQLPRDSRGIIILDVSQQFMLSDFSITTALYGDMQVSFPMVSVPGEPVGETTVERNELGFFGQTSRVSAIVIHKRVNDNGQIKSSWKVYPTNRANSDTIHLKLAELKRFGDVGNREHLSADHAFD